MNADRSEEKPTGGGRQRMKPAWKEQPGSSCADFIKSKKNVSQENNLVLHRLRLRQGHSSFRRKKHCAFTEQFLSCIDVLVDGSFIEELKDISLQFRGSRNQRILHLK